MRPAREISTKTPQKKTFLALWGILWPKDMPSARMRFGIAMTLLVTSKAFLMATPLAFKYAVDALERLRWHDAVWMVVAYGALRIVASLCNEGRDIIFARVTQRALRDAGMRVFKHLHHLSLKFHLNRQTGGLTRVIERGTKGVESLLNFLSMLIIPTFVEVFLAMLVMIWIFDWKYAACTLAVMSLYIGFTLTLTQWRIQFVKSMNQADNSAQTRAIDSLLNFETVKYFNNAPHEERQFDKFLKNYEGKALKSRISLNYLNFGQALIISTGLGILLWMGVHDMKSGAMTLGGVVAINTYLLQLYVPLNNLGFAYREVKISAVNFEDMLEVLDEPQDVQDAPDAHPLILSDDTTVKFENVSFSYERNRKIIDDISFEIPSGQTVAIVGTTGSGKSTISKLLFRFYDPQHGRITINGIDIKTVEQDSVRSYIGVVPQDTVLFNESILYNIQYGRVDACYDDVVGASQKAHLREFIESLPDQYDTAVGERGLKLSGGEKQRVAIARTLLKRPKIFIFDEATSALDTRTERDIQNKLNDVSHGATTLIIAHRLSTVIHANTILVLEKGKIIERGSHNDLLKKDGIYAEMWRRQQEENG